MLQLFGGFAAHAEKLANGKRPKLLWNIAFIKLRYAHGLFHIACHFCKQLVCGNSHGAAYVQFIVNALLDKARGRGGVAEKPFGSGHVKISFVY